jgi:spore coat protein U-like protein
MPTNRRTVSMCRKGLAVVAFAVLLSLPSDAFAACSVSASGVAFGTYNVFNAAPLDSTGTISFTCGILEWLLNLPVSITLSTGQSNTYAVRTMRSGSEVLQYNLYLQPYTVIWGNKTQGTGAYETRGPDLLRTYTVTVYGRVPAGQDVRAGTYTDTIVATINF